MRFTNVNEVLELKKQLNGCIGQLRFCGELWRAVGSGQEADCLAEALIKTKHCIFDARCLVESIDDAGNVKADLVTRSMELVSTIKRSLDSFLRPSEESGDVFEQEAFCQGLASDLDALCGILTSLNDNMSDALMACVYAAPPY